MPATPIVNNFTHPVVAADSRDAAVSWRNHLDRGSRGGVDLAYPFGTEVTAIAAGSVTFEAGSDARGHIARLQLADGRRVEYEHLSEFVGGERQVEVGDVIARSGGSAFGKPRYYSSHLHVHLIVGEGRRNVFDCFTGPAGLLTTHLEDDMYDQAAENRLVERITKLTTPFREYHVGSGIVLVNPFTGKVFPIPSPEFAILIRALGLSAGEVRTSEPEELEFIALLAEQLGTGGSRRLVMTQEQVEKLIAAIPKPELVITGDQLEQIVAAARDGSDAVKALDFVRVAD